MKLLIAYVKPEMLDDVIHALHEVEGVRGASIYEGRGYGAWRMDMSPDAVQRVDSNYRPNARVEVVCSDDVAPDALRAITASARTGMTDDGVAFVLEVETCVRILTGEADERIC